MPKQIDFRKKATTVAEWDRYVATIKRRPSASGRGRVQSENEAKYRRRLWVQEFGSPTERSAIGLPLRGSVDFLERFWCRVAEKERDVCWEWGGQFDTRPTQGYGMIHVAQTSVRAHRVAYELTFGVNLETHQLACHRCDNRRCCNPHHLFIGTQQDNVDDMVRKGRHHNKQRTSCRRGHLLTPDNLAPDKRPNVRKCKTCTKMITRRNYLRRKSAGYYAAPATGLASSPQQD